MDLYSSSWSSPSNIALIKYWGKHPGQLPCNPSISFTLNDSKTFFEIEATKKETSGISLDFYFEDVRSPKFQLKIETFLNSQTSFLPWLNDFHLVMKSKNTFPHSSGIASSASSMSALSLCLLSLDEKIKNKKYGELDFFQLASNLARQASGSACRSVYPFLVSWGEFSGLPLSSNLYGSAVALNDIHSSFHQYCDSIVIVDANEKSVSSRVGHALMDEHPFRDERFKRAESNCQKLLIAMKTGNMEYFIEVVEEEALMLHALMMTSNPSYILLKPNSLLVIEKLKKFRLDSKIPLCFTIDAGPNIHILYPDQFSAPVKKWLSEEFSQFKILHDKVGIGPTRLKE